MVPVLSSQSVEDFRQEILGRGALAGATAACDGVTRANQVQRLLEIVGAYRGPEAVEVLALFVSYQVGRGNIAANTGRLIVNDVLDLYQRSARYELDINDVLSAYLGALKWIYTAISRGHRYHVCRQLRYLKPSALDVAAAVMGIRR